ncbi:hypothetical protein BO94DRAFT_558504 [Aspergillus sclerotioniger CBS 115572]|uniref:NAD(P)-binding protein n=1 Tax=Aspergillus sclerotioniger CBS 115572 TaxID=1450535 RepID=A0A317W1A6_9EURO|nr:hypothetical protein BO94DRAFT_558504 [Aspergillus sclerotioniger CBS 115572]PWY80424.1 hypothetical protein BO94DRAFT_558504 [Aspergillus sclerotioniger CBS 115572]
MRDDALLVHIPMVVVHQSFREETSVAVKPVSEVQIVFATARTDSAPQFQELLREYSERGSFIHLDITEERSVTRAVEIVKSKLDGKELAVSINNAGVSKFGSLEGCIFAELNAISYHGISKQIRPMQGRNDLNDTLETNVNFSPGQRLKTDMGGSGADLPVDLVAEATLDVVFRTTREGTKNPGLNQYDRGELPW